MGRGRHAPHAWQCAMQAYSIGFIICRMASNAMEFDGWLHGPYTITKPPFAAGAFFIRRDIEDVVVQVHAHSDGRAEWSLVALCDREARCSTSIAPLSTPVPPHLDMAMV